MATLSGGRQDAQPAHDKQTALPAAAPHRYAVRLLGAFRLSRDGQAIDTTRWQRRPLSLLRLLAASGGKLSRDEVIDHFWPDSLPEAGGTNLRSLLHLIRQNLGDNPPPIVVEHGWVTLNPAHDWEIDLVQLEEAIRTAGDDPSGLTAALELCQGEALVEDRYEDWAVPIRERMERLYRETVLRLVALQQARGAGDEALRWLERLQEHDPLDETVLRMLLQTLAEAGRRTDSLRVYYRFEDRLKAELDLTPEEETQALVRTLTAVRPEQPDEQLPPLQPTPAPPPTNLPAEPTLFVGREREIGDVAGLLRVPHVRMVTLTGPGGIGKTRLALQVGSTVLHDFPDGVYFVSLAPLREPALVTSAIAGTLGLKEEGDQPLDQALQAQLQGKHLLLILDNFEHLLDAAPLAADLLTSCPRISLLVTSTAVLHLRAEHEYPVPPLALPDLRRLPDLEALSRNEAVTLFVQRAQAARPGFQLTSDNAAAIAEICHRLDGLPLTIELAAARVKLFSPAALLQRLSSRLALLTGGARDLPARQQTLRSLLDWSYELLAEEEKRLFARLAVFAGGWTLDAAEAVCRGAGPAKVEPLDDLASLADKSLVRQSPADQREDRLAMLDTIREYALEQLDRSGEGPEVRRAHAEYYGSLARGAETAWFGAEHGRWLELLESEHDNLRAALSWAIAQGQGDLAACLAGYAWRFWESHGHLSEGRRWLEEVTGVPGAADPAQRSRVYEGLGWLAALQGHDDQAFAALHESLRLAQEAGDERRVAAVLTTQGALAQMQGDYTAAVARYEESIAHSTAAGDAGGAARPRHNLATIAYAQGDLARAQAMFTENVAEMRRLQNSRILSSSLEGLAMALFSQQEYEQAAALLEESLVIARAMGDRRQIASSLQNLGYVVMGQGDYRRADALFEETLALARDMDDRYRVAACLESIGTLAREQGNWERAGATLAECLQTAQQAGYRDFVPALLEELARVRVAEGRLVPAATLFAASDALHRELGIERTGEAAEEYQAEIERVQSRLDAASWASAWHAGCAMSLEEAASYALESVLTAAS